VPVIAFTGYGEAYAAQLAAAGFARVVQKPVDPWQLCDEIRAVIRGR
jgi:CheY-like chemotaxis protein